MSADNYFITDQNAPFTEAPSIDVERIKVLLIP